MRQIGFGKRGAPSGLATSPAPGLVAQAPQRTAFADDQGGGDAPVKLAVIEMAGGGIDALYDALLPQLSSFLPADIAKGKSRSDLATLMTGWIRSSGAQAGLQVSEADARDLVTALLEDFIRQIGGLDPEPLVQQVQARQERKTQASKSSVSVAKDRVQPLLMEHIDASAVSEMSRGELAEQVSDVVSELLLQEKLNLNQAEQRDLVTLLLDDMLGLGPLEPLLADELVTDIMVNGPAQVYAERKGKLELTEVRFRDDQHLLNIAQRIVNAVGRRVDESQPICDARLLDGSRVNVIIPPLAIDGASISIRKFSKKKITLEKMIDFQSLNHKMCQLLKIAGRCRLNILISGGTGSGKTTMLNAVSRNIDTGERVVTVEDAAELQLQQPHVVRLETRPANLEGQGEITMRDLVKNALRMRPDRIILGEVRGGEAYDLLQAMNTGHDGSMGTLHANRPREALSRMENLVNMAGLGLTQRAIREQIAGAVNMIVQVSRMRDGVRRVSYISEIVGMEGDIITMQDLYTYKFTGEDENGKLTGEFVSSGLRPAFYERAEYHGLARALMECM
jgi:pilus assembly protein CpaF